MVLISSERPPYLHLCNSFLTCAIHRSFPLRADGGSGRPPQISAGASGKKKDLLRMPVVVVVVVIVVVSEWRMVVVVAIALVLVVVVVVVSLIAIVRAIVAVATAAMPMLQ
jgi:hypothetical protein